MNILSKHFDSKIIRNYIESEIVDVLDNPILYIKVSTVPINENLVYIRTWGESSEHLYLREGPQSKKCDVKSAVDYELDRQMRRQSDVS